MQTYPILTVSAGSNQGQMYALSANTRLGRHPNCDVSINDPYAADLHAVIYYNGGLYFIADQNTSNGTYVNGVRATQPTQINLGDTLTIGGTQLVFGEAAAQSPPQPVYSPNLAPPVYPAPQPQPSPSSTFPVQPGSLPPQKKRSLGKGCLVLFLLFICGFVALAGGSYYLYTTGALDRRSIQNALGLGAGEMSIVNIADDRVTTDLDYFDPEDNDWTGFNSLSVKPYDVRAFGSMQPGRYRLEILSKSGASLGLCHLRVTSGQIYQFVVVPEGIAVSLKGYQAQTADELRMDKSSLCKG